MRARCRRAWCFLLILLRQNRARVIALQMARRTNERRGYTECNSQRQCDCHNAKVSLKRVKFCHGMEELASCLRREQGRGGWVSALFWDHGSAVGNWCAMARIPRIARISISPPTAATVNSAAAGHADRQNPTFALGGGRKGPYF